MSAPPCICSTAARPWWTHSLSMDRGPSRNPGRLEDRPCHVRYRPNRRAGLQFCILRAVARLPLPHEPLEAACAAAGLPVGRGISRALRRRLPERQRRPLGPRPSLPAAIGNGAGAVVPAATAAIFELHRAQHLRRQPLELRDSGRNLGHSRRISRVACAARSRTLSPPRRRRKGAAPGWWRPSSS